ncbi:MAG: peptidoglycan-associated lipoprotein [Deltaproteobacteria bacterium GWB2_42_7]|nr:MAG: peptidoglycan-associated lipoprotein [Deltaproteobacteria bacterium GWB2_42_7]
MKANSVIRFALIAIILIFAAAGCVKVVKEEAIQKSALPEKQESTVAKKEAKEEMPAIKEERVAEQPIMEASKEKVEAAVVDELGAITEKTGMLLTVYFDFDRFTIRDDMQSVFEKNAEWLKKNSNVKIRIEGHCDERGTNEYNIALGERRAQSIREYLVNYGINPSRLSTISYGEEKPVAAGHDEDSWTKNRRGEFVIVK